MQASATFYNVKGNASCQPTFESNKFEEGSWPAADFETMTDNESATTRDMYNAITHTKHYPLLCRVVPSIVEIEHASKHCLPSTYNYKQEIHAGTFKWSPTVSHGGVFDSIDWNSLVSEVGHSLDGHMKTKSNILVTLGEAMATIGMLKNPLSPLKALRSGRSIRSTLNAVSSGHLSYKYGWKQLYRDCIAFGNVFNDVSEHIEYLNDTAGKFRPLSASERKTIPPDPNDTYSDNRYLCKLSASRGTVERVATFSCMSKLDESIGIQSRFALTLQALGVKKVIEAAWDLVPFSFVVDWMVNWQSFAKDPRRLFDNHNVKMLGHSTKHTWYMKPRVIASLPAMHDGITSASSQWDGDEQIALTQYVRTRGFPSGSETAGVFSSLSVTNMLDGAALILQRIT
jgi:hypothetical protein